VNYHSDHYKFELDDLMILYTDGVSELINPADEEFGTDRIVQVLKKHRHDSVSEIRDALVQELHEYRGDQNQFDDITIILMKRVR
jgi:serine phosphatase RsbU (regulator of sigma subunit)